MKKINLLPTVLMLGWVVIFLLTLSATIGSYDESEPQAGNILFGLSALIFTVGAGSYWKYKSKF